MSNHTTELKVDSIEYETDDTVTIKLKKPFWTSFKYKSGQFLTLLLNINGKEERRSYSFSSADKIDKGIAITVKKVDGGIVSNYVYENIKEGDKVKVMKPLGNFFIEPDKKKSRHIVLFGGGSGITPLMSIAKTILHFEPKSNISLIYCNQRSESIIFKDKLEKLHTQFPDRIKLTHVLENPDYGLGGYVGRVDRHRVAEILSDLKVDIPSTEYYICGPSGMMEQVKEGLLDKKVDSDKINMESFTATLANEEIIADASDSIKDITVKIKGKTSTVEVDPKSNILDAVLDNGHKVLFSCCSGICGSCKAKLTSGEVAMSTDLGLLPNEKEAGYILTCISKPKSDDVSIEFE